MRVITTKVVFHGLYTWGKGYENADIARKWNEFWESEGANSIFWHSFKAGDARYLVTTGGSIYLHPMDFTVLYHKMGRTSTYKNGVEVEEFMEIDSLKEILDRCCAYVGGSYTMQPIKEHQIDA